MKTLIVSLEYPPQVGGIASYVYNFAKHSHDIVVYAPKINGSAQFDLKNSWKTYREKSFWFFWPHWLPMLWQIKKIIKQEKIELIHVHHALPVGYLAKYFFKRMGIPYAVFLHGTDLGLGASVKKRRLASVLRSAKEIVVNSRFMREKLLKFFDQLESAKIKIIFPCPSDSFFEPVKPEELTMLKSRLALDGKKVMLTVGRMADGKGYPHLVRLFPQILEKIPNLVWVIIGDGPKKSIIMEQVEKNSLQNAVRFLGAIPYEDLPKYYQMADIFALLTHKDEANEEGWGTVFLEAAASGLPVVAGRAGGVEEVVKHLETGLVVDTYQDMTVISAIVELAREVGYAKNIGQTGRERALREFRWENQLKQEYGVN